MCQSKEAWDLFVSVPAGPSSCRSARCRQSAAFLRGPAETSTPPAKACARRQCADETRPSSRSGRRVGDVGAARARVTPSNMCRLRDPAPVSADVCAGWVANAAPFAALAATTPGLGPLLKCAMVPPLPPFPAATEEAGQPPADGQPPPPPPGPDEPPGAREDEEQQPAARARQATLSKFLEMLFPHFDMDTFIWRISMLQAAEYAASLLMGGTWGTPKLCSLYLLGASWGPAIAAGAFWRLFLPMTLHANPLHIFYNVFFQLRIGFGMEKEFGRKNFVLLYLFCGFLGNLLSVVSDPMKLAVGASTSGFGLLGVWVAEVLLTWELLGGRQWRLCTWFLFMVISCVMMSTLSPNVDFMGHFGGALGGFLLAIMLADMPEAQRPRWYNTAKSSARNAAIFIVAVSLFKVFVLGHDGPFPDCGTLFYPRKMPF